MSFYGLSTFVFVTGQRLDEGGHEIRTFEQRSSWSLIFVLFVAQVEAKRCSYILPIRNQTFHSAGCTHSWPQLRQVIAKYHVLAGRPRFVPKPVYLRVSILEKKKLDRLVGALGWVGRASCLCVTDHVCLHDLCVSEHWRFS